MDKKRNFFLLQLLLILVFTVSPSTAQTGKMTKPILGAKNAATKTGDLFLQRWTLTEINGSKVIEKKAPFIELNSADKRFTGNGGCNTIFGQVEAGGGKIRFSGVGSTRMFCAADGVMKLEGDFIKALEDISRFEQKGKTLNLFKGNKLILKFSGSGKNGSGDENSKNVRLENEKWVLAFIGGETIKVKNKPTLVFNKQRASAGGNTGCNSYGGNYKTEGEKISFTNIIQTMMACSQNSLMNLEKELLDRLKKTNRFKLENGKLTLFEADNLLLTFDAAERK